jgi:hypothetical protein
LRKRVELIPLRRAVLCAGCETISAASNGHCPACGGAGLISLGAVLCSGEPSAAAGGCEGEIVKALRELLSVHA